MQKLKFINALGHEADFAMGEPFIFWRAEGLGAPIVQNISSRAPGQDGYSLHGLNLDCRQVLLFGHVVMTGEESVRKMYAERKRLARILNPVLGAGRLQYENDHGKWWIPAFCLENIYLDKLRNVQTLSIVFECPTPYWLSLEQEAFSLAYMEGGMQFPLKTPTFFGTMGYRSEIDNDSDGDLPMEITIEGGSKNPAIRNLTTGEHIEVETNIPKGAWLYINTDVEQLEVSYVYVDPETNGRVKENAYGYLTSNSTLLTLKPGRNELTFTSADENRKARIDIRFYKRYVGV